MGAARALRVAPLSSSSASVRFAKAALARRRVTRIRAGAASIGPRAARASMSRARREATAALPSENDPLSFGSDAPPMRTRSLSTKSGASISRSDALSSRSDALSFASDASPTNDGAFQTRNELIQRAETLIERQASRHRQSATRRKRRSTLCEQAKTSCLQRMNRSPTEERLC